MPHYDLSDLRKLKAEVDLAELRYDHHNVSDILKWLDGHIEHYNRLRSMVMFYVSKDYNLTVSQMLGPFLKCLIRVMGDEIAIANGDLGQAESKKPA